MPAPQPNLDASRLLLDDDCDIMDEYRAIKESSSEIRRKFALIVSEARQLRSQLLVEQAKNNDLATRHQQDLLDNQHDAEITRNQLRNQGHSLRKCKAANKVLRRKNKQLATELEVARKELDEVEHLRCNICMESMKNAVTGCSHGFCKPCLLRWLRDRTNRNRCPICRRIVREGEIRDIDLEPGSRVPAVLEDDVATEVLSIDSDSDSDSE
jgi:rubrerythrin